MGRNGEVFWVMVIVTKKHGRCEMKGNMLLCKPQICNLKPLRGRAQFISVVWGGEVHNTPYQILTFIHRIGLIFWTMIAINKRNNRWVHDLGPMSGVNLTKIFKESHMTKLMASSINIFWQGLSQCKYKLLVMLQY